MGSGLGSVALGTVALGVVALGVVSAGAGCKTGSAAAAFMETFCLGAFPVAVTMQTTIPSTATIPATAGISHAGSGFFCGVFGGAFLTGGFTSAGLGGTGVVCCALAGSARGAGLTGSAFPPFCRRVTICSKAAMSCGRFCGRMLIPAARTSNCSFVSRGLQVRVSSTIRSTEVGGSVPVQQ